MSLKDDNDPKYATDPEPEDNDEEDHESSGDETDKRIEAALKTYDDPRNYQLDSDDDDLLLQPIPFQSKKKEQKVTGKRDRTAAFGKHHELEDIANKVLKRTKRPMHRMQADRYLMSRKRKKSPVVTVHTRVVGGRSGKEKQSSKRKSTCKSNTKKKEDVKPGKNGWEQTAYRNKSRAKQKPRKKSSKKEKKSKRKPIVEAFSTQLSQPEFKLPTPPESTSSSSSSSVSSSSSSESEVEITKVVKPPVNLAVKQSSPPSPPQQVSSSAADAAHARAVAAATGMSATVASPAASAAPDELQKTVRILLDMVDQLAQEMRAAKEAYSKAIGTLGDQIVASIRSDLKNTTTDLKRHTTINGGSIKSSGGVGNGDMAKLVLNLLDRLTAQDGLLTEIDGRLDRIDAERASQNEELASIHTTINEMWSFLKNRCPHTGASPASTHTSSTEASTRTLNSSDSIGVRSIGSSQQPRRIQPVSIQPANTGHTTPSRPTSSAGSVHQRQPELQQQQNLSTMVTFGWQRQMLAQSGGSRLGPTATPITNPYLRRNLRRTQAALPGAPGLARQQNNNQDETKDGESKDAPYKTYPI